MFDITGNMIPLYALLGVPLVPLAYLFYIVLHHVLFPYIISWPTRWKLRAIPGPPKTFIIGNIADLMQKSPQHVLAEWEMKYGKLYKIDFMGISALVLSDPEEIARVLKVDKWDKCFPAYGVMEQFTAERCPNIITVPAGPYYKALRRAVTPAFSSANLRQFLPTLVSLTERIMAHLRAQGEVVPFDADEMAQRLTMDVIGLFGLDLDFGSINEGEKGGYGEALPIVRNLTVAIQQMNNPLNTWFPWRKEARKLWKTRVQLSALIDRALDDLRSRPPAPHTLVHHLMNMTDPTTGKTLSPRQLHAESGVFWLAGFETSAHAIAFALMFIAGDPEVQSRVASELDSFGLLANPSRPEPRPLAWSDLGALKYLNAVIQEALRLMPPGAGGTIRETPANAKLMGQPVPKGVMVWIPIYALQRSERVWGHDAVKFRPERWLNSTGGGASSSSTAAAGTETAHGQANRNGALGSADEEAVKAAGTQAASGWIPFSDGPRNCVGQSLAMLELRVTLALLCGQFRFKLADSMGGVEGVVADAREEVTLKPGPKGLLLHAVPRVPA